MTKKKPQRHDKTTTIVEVAQKAGVSVATASRALSGRGYASEAVKERVRQAAQELHYRMNAPARNLKVKRTSIIGLIITTMDNHFYSDLAAGVLDCATQLGYRILLCMTNESPEQERECLKVLMEQRVDGIIAVPTGPDHKLWHEVLDMNMGLVLVDREIQGISSIDAVLVDNVKGTRFAIEHLIQSGHRRIGMICGSPNTTTGRDRVLGYYDAHRAANLAVEHELVQGDSYSRESGQQAIQNLLSLPIPPTAILASSSVLGEVSLTAIRARGLCIPQDISFVMFDDVPWATMVTPTITVISQPTHSLGYVGLRLLDQRLQETTQGVVQAPMKIVLEPELILRDSCLPLSAPPVTYTTGVS